MYKRKEGGEWQDYLRRDNREQHSSTDGPKQKEEWDKGTMPLTGARERAEHAKGGLYHSFQGRGLLNRRPLPHFSMLPVPPLLVLLVKPEPVLLMIVHKSTLQCGLWVSSGPVWQGRAQALHAQWGFCSTSLHWAGIAQPKLLSFISSLASSSTAQRCWTWGCSFMVHLMWLSHLLSWVFFLGFQLDQGTDLTHYASTQHLGLTQGREGGWGQRAGGRTIPLNNSTNLGQLKSVVKPELDLQGLTVSSMDTIWVLTSTCENIVLNHCIFQFCHAYHGVTNASLYKGNVRHSWSMFVKCQILQKYEVVSSQCSSE